MKLNDLLLIAALTPLTALAQPTNDDCSDAIRLCPNVVLSGTTAAATTNAGTDYNFCFTPSSTVWYMFTTDSDGGTVTVDLSNLVFNPDPTMGQQIEAHIIAATTACSIPSYTPISACGSGATNFSVTSSIALAANTTYYFQINGVNTGVGVTQPAECDFDITISGAGVQQTLPTVSISAANTVLCYGDDEIVTSTVTSSDTVNFNWYFNNSLLTSSPTQSTYNAGQLSGSGYLKLIFESDPLCTVSDADSIYFEVTPIAANAGPDKFIAPGEQVQLDGSGDGSPLWVPAATLTDASSFTPVATPETTTYYYLTVTNGSCTATDSMRVYVGDVITVYSSFTPNGDAINDKWIIQNSGQFDNMEIKVYDRSGQVVFEATNYSVQEDWWDGTFKNQGKPLPASTYFYVIDLKEGDYPLYKGSVTIIR